MNKIVLISSGQPSLNPRLVKEADTLADAGYKVIVLYAYWNDWGTELDRALIPSKKWEAICVGGDPHQKKLTYFFSRLIHKLAKTINQKTSGKILVDLAIGRSGYFLIRAAKRYKADLYIGHNPGALAATVKAAKANKKLCGFDAEDFHRNEVSDNNTDPDVILKTRLEERYIPQVDYLSASSPLIAATYKKLFPNKEPTVILNVFPSGSQISLPVYQPESPVKLFWFSQTIGPARGLEETINALDLLKEYPFELHLLGYIPKKKETSFADSFIKTSRANIFFHDPIPPDQIIAFASQFDIGLAVETGKPLNRDLCLTNKIFTYLQAGLAVVASDTSAQKDLLNQYPGTGKIYQKGNHQSLADALVYYHQRRKELFEARKAALTIAQEQLNWENESRKFLNLVDQTLNSN
jgi:glycosyltransferase involved in cell wall biosynthesis